MSSDCWSLGMIVLECALGYFPFSDPSITSPQKGAVIGNLAVFPLMQKIINSDPCSTLEGFFFFYFYFFKNNNKLIYN